MPASIPSEPRGSRPGLRKYDLYALPVVDSTTSSSHRHRGRLLDVAEEAATEDFHKLATVSPLQISFKDATLGLLFRKRIGWLVGLVVVNIFTGMGIKMFEDTIVAVAALVALMPLLIGSGGNAGAQAATLVVRAIATGEIGSGTGGSCFCGKSASARPRRGHVRRRVLPRLGDRRPPRGHRRRAQHDDRRDRRQPHGHTAAVLLNRLKLDRPPPACVDHLHGRHPRVLIYFSIANAVLHFFPLHVT
jgi:hypothetical protein